MRSSVGVALAGGLLLAGSAGASDITFYENDGFNGRRFTATSSVSDFAGFGFNDRASSVTIRSGSWQVCTDAFFRGRCVTLDRGEYPSLGAMGLNDRISSAREVGWSGGGGGGGRAGVTLYDYIDFGGRSFAVDREISNLDGVFNDRAQSLIVHAGTWELCADAGYGGGCQSYGPGRYASLGALSARLSSLRPAGGGGGGGNWGGGGSRAVLYQGTNLSGRSFVIENYMPNLDGTGFNDRGSSLRIERGYWMFCSDANFQGECRTFGPGDYPTLSPGLNNRISSGRRISSEYPYNRNPNWDN
ncbi:MAG: beta/gamma crystallin family protein [Betaproteobacteria bacterium]|nr:beta/gamma crystallin family protein [Betaproteobacteria bacterium]